MAFQLHKNAAGKMSKTKKNKKERAKTVRADVMERAKELRGDPHVVLDRRYLYIEADDSVLILNHPPEKTVWLNQKGNSE